MRHKQAQTTEARANQKVAEADRHAAENDSAAAKANEDAARAGADNEKVRRHEDDDAAALPHGDADRLLHDEWGK